MKQFINPDKIIEAYISEPYESEGHLYSGNSHGWQVRLVVGYTNESYPITVVLDKKNEYECICLIVELNLKQIV